MGFRHITYKSQYFWIIRSVWNNKESLVETNETIYASYSPSYFLSFNKNKKEENSKISDFLLFEKDKKCVRDYEAIIISLVAINDALLIYTLL